MKIPRTLLLAFALWAGNSLLAAPVFRSGPAQVALVELYTSEGCSSCPPAEKWLGELRSDPGLWKRFVPVAFHVNYWDRLGWRDVFSSPDFTQRQYRYAEAWRASNVYTPCFVRNGREWRPAEGSPAEQRPAATGELAVTGRSDREYQVTFTPARDTRNPPPAQLEVSVALLGGGIVSPVRAGENSGRKLLHEFVALSLVTVSLTRADDGTFAAVVTLPASAPPGLPSIGRRALAAWITAPGRSVPLQAAGGWL